MIIPYLGKKYGLDYIPGAYESCVAFFSYYQPSAKYKDEICRIRRLDTGAERDIGPVNGYIEYPVVNSFCAGTTGLVKTIYNSGSAAGKQDAIQITVGNMPIIYEAGAFLHDGFKFVAANSNIMSITDYTGIQIIDPQLTIICKYKADLSTGYLFSKGSLAAGAQYIIRTFYTVVQNNFVGYTPNSNPTIDSNESCFGMMVWKNKNVDGVVLKNSIAQQTVTEPSALVNKADTTIGGRVGSSHFLNGNIKTLAIFNSDMYNNYTQLSALI
jgi:hypothetical protein